MFFVLSKVLGFFATPSNLVISLGLVRPRFCCARALPAPAPARGSGSLVALAMLGPVAARQCADHSAGAALSALGRRARRARRHPRAGRRDLARCVAGARRVALNEAAERMTAVAELARRYPEARIVFSGGSGALLFDEGNEAEFAARLLESLGIPRARILLEDRSRNTVENALFSKELAQPKPGERWLLVTSALSHAAVDRRLSRRSDLPSRRFRSTGARAVPRTRCGRSPTVGDGLRRTDTAVREWVGLVIYWMTGQSAELFPAPTPRK